MSTSHTVETHKSGRAAWLRAAVLGANDGLISTSALICGVAAASNERSPVLIAGISGLAAGALAMAAGEYVSVSSQRDTELADIEREKRELEATPEAERDELVDIYLAKGLSRPLAEQVADELSARPDRLAIHVRDELGFHLDELANPLQAAVVSALSFVVGAIVPIIVVLVAGAKARIPVTIGVALAGLVVLGAYGARLGGAPQGRAAVRVLIGGALALAIALGIGKLTGQAV